MRSHNLPAETHQTETEGEKMRQFDISDTAQCEFRLVCLYNRELKVVTGEWFLEERSKRFEQKVLSSDVVKQSILSSPPSESDR